MYPVPAESKIRYWYCIRSCSLPSCKTRQPNRNSGNEIQLSLSWSKTENTACGTCVWRNTGPRDTIHSGLDSIPDRSSSIVWKVLRRVTTSFTEKHTLSGISLNEKGDARFFRCGEGQNRASPCFSFTPLWFRRKFTTLLQLRHHDLVSAVSNLLMSVKLVNTKVSVSPSSDESTMISSDTARARPLPFRIMMMSSSSQSLGAPSFCDGKKCRTPSACSFSRPAPFATPLIVQ
eukprot:gene6105-biopygen6056